jgi:hypothetical protein
MGLRKGFILSGRAEWVSKTLIECLWTRGRFGSTETVPKPLVSYNGR